MGSDSDGRHSGDGFRPFVPPFGWDGERPIDERVATTPGTDGPRGKRDSAPKRQVDPTATTYRVDVDFSDDQGHLVKPLSGVNKGVLTYPKYGIDKDGLSAICDLSSLYHAIGITSVRTHDDVFDVANILRGEGSFAKGIAFRDGLQLPDGGSTYFWTSLYSHLNSPGLDGYIFSVAILNEFLANAFPGFPEFAGYDAWLYWYPRVGAPDNATLFQYDDATTGVRASYDALAVGGFEIYFRVGESFNGPTYMAPKFGMGHPGDTLSSKERYATAVNRILEHLVTTQDPDAPMLVYPGFIEIWNEPAAIGYHCPDAQWNQADPQWTTWSSDFRDLADRTGSAVEWAAPVGGFGFNRAQLKQFVNSVAAGQSSKSMSVLRDLDLAAIPFVSFHWYRDLEEPRVDPLLEVLRFPRDLVELRDALDTLARFQKLPLPIDGIPIKTRTPPLHITEWNFLANPDRDHDFPKGALWGAFASAGLTWMQHPLLNVERAHYWDGHVDLGLEVDDQGNISEQTDHGVGLFTVRETFGGIEFIARASALSTALHSGIAGDSWIAVILERTRDPLGSPQHDVADDVFDAADARFELTALASFDETSHRHSLILTNLAEEPRSATLSLSGLASAPTGYYEVRVRTFAIEAFPADGVVVQGHPSDGRIVPEIDQFEASMEAHIVETVTQEDEQGSPPDFELGDLEVEVPSHGVVRVDVLPGPPAPTRPGRDAEG